MKRLLTTACAIACMGTAAAASTVTVSFETDDAGFVSVPVGGTAGTPLSAGIANFGVVADTFDIVGGDLDLNGERRINITQNVEGLGVNNRNPDSDDNIDGFGSNDILIFSFDRDVRLEEIIFENVSDDRIIRTRFGPINLGGNDDFVFYVPGSTPNFSESDIDFPLPFPDTDGDEGSFNFGGQVVSMFGIGALGRDDNFRVSKITVSEVPLPASALLLLAGVGGLAAMSRKKS